jgi:hypothetical protein
VTTPQYRADLFLFIDAINVKIREGQVANRPVYLALGVTVDGERDVLGLWAGEHGDGEGPSTGSSISGRPCPSDPAAQAGEQHLWRPRQAGQGTSVTGAAVTCPSAAGE